MSGKEAMHDLRFKVIHKGEEMSLVTRTSDGQMLFLANMVSKMQHGTPLGSRIACGLPKGAYRRIGSSDVRCTAEDLAVFYGDRSSQSLDATVILDAEMHEIDPVGVAEYRRVSQSIAGSVRKSARVQKNLLGTMRIFSGRSAARIRILWAWSAPPFQASFCSAPHWGCAAIFQWSEWTTFACPVANGWKTRITVSRPSNSVLR
jgi:membrane-bound inhibitor of C-type lysozyme